MTLEGPVGEPQCVTPADKYPPVAPTRLVAQPADGGVDLVWSARSRPTWPATASCAARVTNALLQLLATELVATPAFRDTTAKSGVTYIYSVIAVDKSGNESEQSNRQEVTARLYRLARRLRITEKSQRARRRTKRIPRAALRRGPEARGWGPAPVSLRWHGERANAASVQDR